MTAIIPITSLAPFEAPPVQSSIRAIVALVFPYSSSTKQCALLLSDPDFRLRNRRGQVRVRFTGPSAEAVANSRLGIGDEVVLELNGASWTETPANLIATPGKSIDGELCYSALLSLKIQNGGLTTASVLVHEPEYRTLQRYSQDVMSTPKPTKALSSFPYGPGGLRDADQAALYDSPAFVKRLRLSGTDFVGATFDALGEEDINGGFVPSKRQKIQWRYLERSPSPVTSAIDETATHYVAAEHSAEVNALDNPSSKRSQPAQAGATLASVSELQLADVPTSTITEASRQSHAQTSSTPPESDGRNLLSPSESDGIADLSPPGILGMSKTVEPMPSPPRADAPEIDNITVEREEESQVQLQDKDLQDNTSAQQAYPFLSPLHEPFIGDPADDVSQGAFGGHDASVTHYRLPPDDVANYSRMEGLTHAGIDQRIPLPITMRSSSPAAEAIGIDESGTPLLAREENEVAVPSESESNGDTATTSITDEHSSQAVVSNGGLTTTTEIAAAALRQDEQAQSALTTRVDPEDGIFTTLARQRRLLLDDDQSMHGAKSISEKVSVYSEGSHAEEFISPMSRSSARSDQQRIMDRTYRSLFGFQGSPSPDRQFVASTNAVISEAEVASPQIPHVHPELDSMETEQSQGVDLMSNLATAADASQTRTISLEDGVILQPPMSLELNQPMTSLAADDVFQELAGQQVAPSFEVEAATEMALVQPHARTSEDELTAATDMIPSIPSEHELLMESIIEPVANSSDTDELETPVFEASQYLQDTAIIPDDRLMSIPGDLLLPSLDDDLNKLISSPNVEEKASADIPMHIVDGLESNSANNVINPSMKDLEDEESMTSMALSKLNRGFAGGHMSESNQGEVFETLADANLHIGSIEDEDRKSAVPPDRQEHVAPEMEENSFIQAVVGSQEGIDHSRLDPQSFTSTDLSMMAKQSTRQNLTLDALQSDIEAQDFSNDKGSAALTPKHNISPDSIVERSNDTRSAGTSSAQADHEISTQYSSSLPFTSTSFLSQQHTMSTAPTEATSYQYELSPSRPVLVHPNSRALSLDGAHEYTDAAKSLAVEVGNDGIVETPENHMTIGLDNGLLEDTAQAVDGTQVVHDTPPVVSSHDDPQPETVPIRRSPRKTRTGAQALPVTRDDDSHNIQSSRTPLRRSTRHSVSAPASSGAKADEDTKTTPAAGARSAFRKSVSSRLAQVPEAISSWFSPRRSTRLLEDKKNGHAVSQKDERLTASSPQPVATNGFATSHGYFTPLSLIQEKLNPPSQAYSKNTLDILAVVAEGSSAPARAKKGPRDFFTVLQVQDPSQGQQDESITVEVFRPWRAQLPVAQVGDVILLRDFTIKSRRTQPYLLSCDSSAWCVWRYEQSHSRPASASGGPVWPHRTRSSSVGSVREEVKGPPVELGEEERARATELHGWWRSLHDACSV